MAINANMALMFLHSGVMWIILRRGSRITIWRCRGLAVREPVTTS